MVKLKNVLGFLPGSLGKIGQELRHLCHDRIDRSRRQLLPSFASIIGGRIGEAMAGNVVGEKVPPFPIGPIENTD